jgi:hypothetical protein
MNQAACPYCGFDNDATASFCGRCGRGLAVAPPLAAAARQRGYLLPLALLAGLLVVAAVAAFFLLPRLDFKWPPALAGLLGQQAPGDQPAAVAGEPTNQPAADPPSRVAESIQLPTKEADTGNEDGQTASVAEISPTAMTQATTVTPFPTSTPRPTLTPLPPTPRPSPTPIPLPTAPPPPTSPPPVACQVSPGDRWGPTLWDRYQDELGCATAGEIRTNAAYQYFQHGMLVWRQDADRIYALYNNGAFASYRDDSPDGYFDSQLLKGGFGYLWNNNSTLRNQIGQPEAAEFNATDFAAQDFAGGTIFYFFENNAHNYALFNGSGTWVSAQE